MRLLNVTQIILSGVLRILNSLVSDLQKETQKTKRIYPPLYWEKWDCSKEEFTEAVCELWNTWNNPHIRNNLIDLTGKNEQFYYEVCNTPYKRGVYVHQNELLNWCVTNQKLNQHHSVFYHNQTWIDQIQQLDNGEKKVGGVQDTIVGTDFLQIELDRKLEGLQKAIDDGIKIKTLFPFQDYIHLFYSGNNSIHVAVDMGVFGNPVGNQKQMAGRGKLFWNLAHKIAGDVRYDNGIIDAYKAFREDKNKLVRSYVKEFNTMPKDDTWVQDMENLDPNLFNVNSLVRSPYSWHEKGKRQKTLLDPTDLWSGQFKSNKRLTKQANKPYLLHWYYDCIENTHKKPKKNFASNASSTYIEEVFFEAFDEFDPHEANSDGWVNGLYSCLYSNDTNPSVGVNIKTGQYKDFGLIAHSFTFEEFLSKYKNISVENAKKLIENNE